jgi:hypothetical protein
VSKSASIENKVKLVKDNYEDLENVSAMLSRLKRNLFGITDS